MNTNKHECQTTEHKTLYFIAISVCLLIFVALRARWIGHLLTWDEAMNLCAVRALATYSHDHFSNWFWRHPPLFPMLMLLLHPLKQGFAERTEIMCIVIGIINLSMLYLLNKKIYGKLAALLSSFFLAIMPGSVFFDVWIKR
ncbi:MAG: hypothetical protein KAH23_03600, partial [Kiritimatiellae bacterium]|nr:hypothetical protein [Kiritimatiellia bacterium]